MSAAGAGKIGSAVGFSEGTSGNGDFETRPWRLKASPETALWLGASSPQRFKSTPYWRNKTRKRPETNITTVQSESSCQPQGRGK